MFSPFVNGGRGSLNEIEGVESNSSLESIDKGPRPF